MADSLAELVKKYQNPDRFLQGDILYKGFQIEVGEREILRDKHEFICWVFVPANPSEVISQTFHKTEGAAWEHGYSWVDEQHELANKTGKNIYESTYIESHVIEPMKERQEQQNKAVHDLHSWLSV